MLKVHSHLTSKSEWTKRSFGQGNIFTGMCDSVHRGGSAPNFRGGVGGSAPNFRGWGGGWVVCLLQIFGGVSAPNFWGGLLQIFGGGGVVSNFRNTVNVRPVRILLECILVAFVL